MVWLPWDPGQAAPGYEETGGCFEGLLGSGSLLSSRGCPLEGQEEDSSFSST